MFLNNLRCLMSRLLPYILLKILIRLCSIVFFIHNFRVCFSVILRKMSNEIVCHVSGCFCVLRKTIVRSSASELINGCEDMFTHVRNIERCSFSVLNLER